MVTIPGINCVQSISTRETFCALLLIYLLMLYPHRVAKTTLTAVTATDTTREFFIYVPSGIDCQTLLKLSSEILDGKSVAGETITSSVGFTAVTTIQ